MKLFLDANILVSVVNYELPLFPYSSRVLSLQKKNPQFELFTSPICLAITFYFAQKKCSTEKALQKMKILSEQIKITSVGPKEVIELNKNKSILDYEDGLQYYSALSEDCDAIITEDLNDFHFSKIPVYNSKDFILNILA
jgi:predicted nucleic acid-binding protein